jgi:hypothetical protein
MMVGRLTGEIPSKVRLVSLAKEMMTPLTFQGTAIVGTVSARQSESQSTCGKRQEQ